MSVLLIGREQRVQGWHQVSASKTTQEIFITTIITCHIYNSWHSFLRILVIIFLLTELRYPCQTCASFVCVCMCVWIAAEFVCVPTDHPTSCSFPDMTSRGKAIKPQRTKLMGRHALVIFVCFCLELILGSTVHSISHPDTYEYVCTESFLSYMTRFAYIFTVLEVTR